MNIKFLCILSAAVLLTAGITGAQSNLLIGEANQNFVSEIQPRLLEQASDPETSPFDYMLITKRLGIYGDASAVPIVTRELANPAKSMFARNALEEMPFPEALAALRSAAENLSDPVLKAGIFNSLGMRRDREAVSLLTPYLDSDNDVVAESAFFALVRIANPATKDLLIAKMSAESDEAKRKASDFCLMYGDFLRRDGLESEALDVFRAVKNNGFADYHREAAFYQILLNEDKIDNEEVYQALVGDDLPAYLGTIRAAQFAKSEMMAKNLVRAYDDVSADRKAAVAAALTRWTIPEARSIVVEALASPDAQLREDVMGAFQSTADRGTILSFIDAVAAGDTDLKTRAASVLIHFDKSADSVFLELFDGDINHQLLGASAVALRKIFEGRAKVMTLTQSTESELRDAGFAALGAVADLDAFCFLADNLETGGSSVVLGLKRACGTVEERDAAALYLEKMDSSLGVKKEVREIIFECYPILGGSAALAAVEKAAFSNNNESRDLATKALGRWMSIDASETLLKLAETNGYPYANRALRGVLRLVKQFNMEENQRKEILDRASKSPAGNEETNAVIEAVIKQYQL